MATRDGSRRRKLERFIVNGEGEEDVQDGELHGEEDCYGEEVDL